MLDGALEILDVLSRNKLRTFLTALSVAWGMFMLAILLGAGRGLENGMAWEFRDGAIAALWVRSGETSVPFAGKRPGRAIHFSNEDYEVLARELPGIGERSGRFYMWGEFQVSYGQKAASFDVRGTHPGHRYIEKTEMLRGRFLNDVDIRERRKVAAIGVKVRQTLFGEQNPIGAYITIRGLNYLVVGEFEDVGGEAELNKIFVPISIAQLVYGQPDIIHNLMFTLNSDDVERSRQTAEATRALLGKRHAVSPDDKRAIRVQNNLETFRRVTQVSTWLNAFIWVVALGTLLAGIVGVGNIMLIAVAERTREIGVRKAVGATAASIVSMILAESIVITALSGYLGLLAGVGAVEAVAAAKLEMPFLREPAVDIRVCLMATALLTGAGTLAGLFPALRAARVDPIVALREGA